MPVIRLTEMDFNLNTNKFLVNNSLVKSKLDSLYENTVGTNPRELTDVEKAEFAKAARGFESMFLNMIYQGMKSAMLEDEDSEDMTFGANTISGYSDMLFADELANSGTGVGIAKMIYSQLTGGGNLELLTQNLNGVQLPKRIYKSENSVEIGIKQAQPNTDKSSKSSTERVNKTNSDFISRVANRISGYEATIAKASRTNKVPENLIKAIITAESAGRHDAVSKAGAKGLMQLMDGTASEMGVSNSFDPSQNIAGGTKYISKMLEIFDNNLDLALAAYNSGPGNVMKYGGIPPFKETQAYIVRVKRFLNQFEGQS